MNTSSSLVKNILTKASLQTGVLLTGMLGTTFAFAGPMIVPDDEAAKTTSTIDSRNLQDILELERLKGLYFYHLDHKNWDAWKTLFTQDAQFLVDRNDEQGAHTLVTTGLDNVMAYVKAGLATAPTVHQGYTPLYEFTSDTEASGIWTMSDIVYYSEDKVLYGYGHYHEQYRKENGVWKFARVHLTRLKVDIVTKGN
jgi:hypothetical protein